jgi:hypothetical protein
MKASIECRQLKPAPAVESASLHCYRASVSGHALRHAVNIAGDAAKVHGALTTLERLKGWTMAEVSGGVGS